MAAAGTKSIIEGGTEVGDTGLNAAYVRLCFQAIRGIVVVLRDGRRAETGGGGWC